MSVVLQNVSRTVGGVTHIRNLSLTLERGTLRRASQGGLALPAVHHLEDGVAEEEPCRPDLHP